MKAVITVNESRQAGGTIEMKSRSIVLTQVEKHTAIFCDQIAAVAPYIDGYTVIFLTCPVQIVVKGSVDFIMQLISTAYVTERMQAMDLEG